MTPPSEVERLLEAFRRDFASGGDVDPRRYLEQVEGTDRLELAELIDAYLARAPREAWDAAAFRGSAAERAAETAERSVLGASGAWPALLPSLRNARRLTRAEVVRRLAAALGVEGREPKVATYYHEMERGLLPARGVSDRVLEALADILGDTLEGLRRAGEAAGLEPPPAGAVFARTATPSTAFPPAAPGAPTAAGDAPEAGAEASLDRPDEVDLLFRGG